MQTTAKCKLLPQHKKFTNKIIKGADVYRYYRGVEKEGAEAAVIPGKASGETKRIGNMEFVYVPGGTFLMGSPQGEGYEDEHPQHKVTLDGFWMGKFEVTQKQFKEIMGYNPGRFSGKPDNPVEQVSWLEARDFCDKFSINTVLQPAFLLKRNGNMPQEAVLRQSITGAMMLILKSSISMRCMKRTVLIKVKRIPDMVRKEPVVKLQTVSAFMI
jgi:hypothetical protein